jgi:hypothetical protein
VIDSFWHRGLRQLFETGKSAAYVPICTAAPWFA